MNSIRKWLSIVSIMIFMILTPQVVLGLAPGGAPFFHVSVEPEVGEAEAGGSAILEVAALSQEGFEGDVEWTLENAPAGVTATFDPNPVFVPGFDEGVSIVTIEVDAAVSQGEIELIILGTDPSEIGRASCRERV